MISIQIANDFSKLPGPRYRIEGLHSGEQFRDELLRPRFDQARAEGEKLIVDLDGVTFGYPASFLEESFGGMARALGIQVVLDGVSFISNDEPLVVDEIHSYILNANTTSPERAASRERTTH
jgi:hypothetical protein